MSPASGRRDRPRHRRRAFLAASLLALSPVAAARGLPADPAAGPPASPASDLPALLVRMDRAASLYRQAALSFSCREAIHSDGGPVLRFEYLYVVGKDGKLRDYRTRVGDSQALEVAPESIPVKHAMLRPYSWVFLFGRDRWTRLRYRVLETGKRLGRDAVLVAFEPVPPILPEINGWTGTAWVEPATGRILHVEAQEAESLETLRLFEAAMAPGEQAPAGGNRFPVMTATTDFGVEKGGMLFPTRATVEIEEHRFPGRGGRSSSTKVVYRILQTYADYRFFGVRAEEKQPRAVRPP
ncbi:MAG TPA: hypothetical protein VFQ07_07915 [Candidatus Polarisedimenticolia bacterium]|nr:hypothetical protein [Candidatus Polarisedimenticolia bacterium]